MIVNPGIRRFLGSAIQRLFNSASFYAPLTHTAVPVRAAPGTTATFTRATTKTWKNNDGYLVTLLAGEIGFPGARRVDNLIRLGAAQSSTLAIAANVTMTLPAGAYQFSMGAGTGTATFSGTGGATGTLAASASGRVFVAKTITAGTLIVTGSAAILNDIQVVSMVAETDQTTIREYVSVGVPSDWAGDELVTNGTFATDTTGWTAKNTGSLSVVAGKLRVTNGVFGGAEQVITTVAGTKYVLSRNFTAGTSTACITQIGTSAGANDLYDSGIVSTANLSAEFTATSTTTYIQVYLGDGTGGNYADFDNISVKPAYYHGSFVDGVKCYATDINGSPIPSSTLLGYQAQGARTNLCLQSNAFTTAPWADGNTPSATQNVTGPDGATSAWTMTDNNAAALEFVTQDIVLTAATYTASIFVKKTTGAQASYPVLAFYPGVAAMAICTIDTSNGVATAWTAYTGFTIASGLTASCVNYSDDFWRVSMTFTGTAATWKFEPICAGTTNPTQSSGVMDVTAQGSAVFYGAQVELGSSASSYIATTTAAVTRNADVLTYPSAGNIDGTKGWVYCEATTNSQANHAFVGFDTSNQLMSQSNQRVSMYDAANQAVSTSTITLDTRFKGAVTWGSDGVKATLNGEAPGSNASFDGDAVDGKANIYIGYWSDGTGSNDGTIRNVRIGQRQLSASELQAITS